MSWSVQDAASWARASCSVRAPVRGPDDACPAPVFSSSARACHGASRLWVPGPSGPNTRARSAGSSVRAAAASAVPPASPATGPGCAGRRAGFSGPFGVARRIEAGPVPDATLRPALRAAHPPRSRLCQPSQRGQGPRRESTRRQRPAQPARQQSSGQNDLHRQCALFRPRLTPHVHTASFTPRSRHRAYTRPPTLTGGSIARARFAVSTMGKQRSGPGRLRSAPTGRCPRPRVDPAASHQVGPAAQQRQYKALLASLISKPPPHTSGADSTADAIQPSSETSTPYAWG